MFRFNMLKINREDPSSYRCCFCCHVRTGTAILGLWNLCVHLFVIGVLVVASIHPEVLRNSDVGSTVGTDGIIVDISGTDYQSGCGEYETPNMTSFFSMFKQLTREDMCIAFAITMCTLMISMLLLYGTVKSRPGYLMPFFCLQVFDFCLSCLTVVGYFSYAPNIKLWVKEQGLCNYPGMQHILQVDGEWLMLVCVLIFILFLSIKAYFIGVVWNCYKYLQIRNVNRNSVREYSVDPDTEMLLPPKYEEAIKQVDATSVENPPPPYSPN